MTKVPTIKQLLSVLETARIPIDGLKIDDKFVCVDIDVVMEAFAKAIRKYLKERENKTKDK